MSDPHDDHSTFIKTPKQLIVAVVAFLPWSFCCP